VSNQGKKKGQVTGKKEQFTNSGKRSNMPLVLGLLSLAVIGGLVFFIVTRGNKAEEQAQGSYFGEPVSETRSYVGRYLSMTTVEPEVDGEWIVLPLQTVEENSIVYFEVENNQGFMVPLMAYITPSGRLFAGSSMCEPCRGRYFSLAGETLVCDTCRTTYTIESHQFISGSRACGSYPPVYMSPQVENGVVKIALAQVLEWRIRAF
jgi:hypothetical protein